MTATEFFQAWFLFTIADVFIVALGVYSWWAIQSQREMVRWTKLSGYEKAKKILGENAFRR